MDGIFGFSTMPLRLATYLGFLTVGLTMLSALLMLFWRVFGFEFVGHTARELPGWIAVVGVTLFFGGIQLLILGVIGEYLGRIYSEVKRRPRWIVCQTLGIPNRKQSPEGGVQVCDRHRASPINAD